MFLQLILSQVLGNVMTQLRKAKNFEISLFKLYKIEKIASPIAY